VSDVWRSWSDKLTSSLCNEERERSLHLLVLSNTDQHLVSLGKEEPYTIESVNANLRTSLKRLARRSRCFSRPLEALRRALRLFAYYDNHRQRLYLAHPTLRGRLTLLTSPLPMIHSSHDYRVQPQYGKK
jgi:hypothetical protein